MAIIADVKPADATSDISVFSKPQAVFNMPVGRAFAIDAPDGERYKFRARLDKFVTLNGTAPIEGDLLYNADSTVVTLNMRAILPQKTSLTATAIIFYEEFKHGAWQKVLDEGKAISEAKASTFTTGKAPDHIIPDNVDIEYPVRGQKCFYRDEYGKGFVVLDVWQTNLFDNPKFKAVAYFKVGDSVVAKMDVTTNVSKNEINFDIPQSLMATSTDYKMVLVNEPTDKNTGNDKNVTTKETKMSDEKSSEGEITITAKEAKTDLVVATDKDLYTVAFRTSGFKKLVEKLNSLTIKVYRGQIATDLYGPLLNFGGNELFDEIERNGSKQTKNNPLVTWRSDLSANAWYVNEVKPFIYDGYPFLKVGKTNRDTPLFGLPPSGPIEFGSTATNDYLFYRTPWLINADYNMIGDNLCSLYLNRSSLNSWDKTRFEKIISTKLYPFYVAKNEATIVSVYYTIPNGLLIKSGEISFKYFINK